MSPRVLLRLAFDGSLFRGTQRQPHRETVNDALLDALKGADLLAEDPHVRAQGRKDSGVSAVDYPIALDVTGTPETVARTIAGSTVGIVPWAAGEVEHGYDPRLEARSRTYRYHLPLDETLAVEAIRDAWRSFEGTHDFSGFARSSERTRKREPVRTIELARSWVDDGFLVLECTGRSFLWNQVRRMVGAAKGVGADRVTVEAIETALEGTMLQGYEAAPPDGLVLWRVALGVEVPEQAKAREVALGRLSDRRQRARQRAHVLDLLFA